MVASLLNSGTGKQRPREFNLLFTAYTSAMKFPSLIITIFLLCCIFFFLGFLAFSKFYQVVLPDIYGLQYQMDLAEVGDMQTMFAIVIGLIPLSLFITWQLIPLHSPDKQTSTVFIVLICMVSAVYIRYKVLVHYFEGLVQSLTDKTSTSGVKYPFNELGFEYYLFGGLLCGCIISYLLFHNVIKRRVMYNRDLITD